MSVQEDAGTVGERLHRRLIAGDELAPSIIAETFLPSLVAALKRKFHDLPDPALVPTACIDALMSYLRAPEKYEASRGNMFSYLLLLAKGDLLNLVAKERRRRTHETPDKVVELRPVGRVQVVEPPDPRDFEATLLSQESPMVAEAMALLDSEVDREILRAMMDGVREPEEYAAIMGIPHLPPEQKFATVKRAKDRLRKVVQRGLTAARKAGEP